MFNKFKKKKTKEQEQEEALAELRALPRPAMDFSTPEGAILCLEDAYRHRVHEDAGRELLRDSSPSGPSSR
jgi:hypothetical protein